MRAALFTAVLAVVPALAGAQQPCTSNADSVVDAVYRQILERPAGGDANARADQLRNGQTSVRDIVRDVARSPEHERFLPANNRAQAVNNLYRHILGRDPDPEGLNSHVQGRIALVALVDTFVNSAEYQQKFGDNGVPGTTLRYCREGGISSSNNGRNRFRNMDRNGNGSIERAEWNGNQAAFDSLDWNRDGVLTGDEVQGGARGGGARRAAERDFDPAAPATWTDQTFRELDRNRDNRITSSEWFHSADYFRRADRNRDGALTLDEFTGTASSNPGDFASLDTDHSGTVTPNEWRWTRRTFERYDTDRDGLLTRREFTEGGGAPAEGR
jgi:Ca2+-binding EF-hand superfamily protein